MQRKKGEKQYYTSVPCGWLPAPLQALLVQRPAAMEVNVTQEDPLW